MDDGKGRITKIKGDLLKESVSKACTHGLVLKGTESRQHPVKSLGMKRAKLSLELQVLGTGQDLAQGRVSLSFLHIPTGSCSVDKADVSRKMQCKKENHSIFLRLSEI